MLLFKKKEEPPSPEIIQISGYLDSFFGRDYSISRGKFPGMGVRQMGADKANTIGLFRREPTDVERLVNAGFIQQALDSLEVFTDGSKEVVGCSGNYVQKEYLDRIMDFLDQHSMGKELSCLVNAKGTSPVFIFSSAISFVVAPMVFERDSEKIGPYQHRILKR